LFWPFLQNASLACVPDGFELDMRLTIGLIAKFRVSVLQFVPSHFQLLCSEIDFKVCSSIKLVTVGGELLSRMLHNNFIESHPFSAFWNVFGPTETTIVMMAFDANIERGEVTRSSICVGKPFCNTVSISFVDKRWRSRHGELLICGKSVGGGYLNNLEESKQKYVYNNILENDGCAKMYTTGDQIQFLEMGNVEYVGRNDDQVKINGHRVELGAVQSAVLSCSNVKQCAILVVESINGCRSLAAFVVVRNPLVTSVTIREEVSRKAMRHEVPHRIILVESIPLTRTGKADRAALKKLLGDESAFSETLTSHESVRVMVKSAIAHVLGCFDESKTFWELGGSSLMAMSLNSILQVKVGVGIGVSQLLKDGSYEGMVQFLAGELARNNRFGLYSHSADSIFKGDGAEHPLQKYGFFSRVTIGQEGLFVLWKLNRGTEYNLGGIFLDHVDERSIWKILCVVVERHSSLRTRRVLQVEQTVLQEIGPNGDVIDYAFVEGVSDVEVSAYETSQPWNLELGRLLRARGVGYHGDGSASLILAFPHIIADEWSCMILIEDLRHRTRQEDRDNSLQFWEFAHFEWAVLERERAELKNWWKIHLKGTKPTVLTGSKDVGVSRRLLRIPRRSAFQGSFLARTAGVSEFAVWQGFFAYWMWRVMDREEDEDGNILLVGPFGRREDLRFQRSFGFFSNMIIYKYEMRKVMNVFDFMRESSKIIAVAIEKGGMYPFSCLIRDCDVKSGDSLMNIRFSWLQNLIGGERTNLGAKNDLVVFCNGTHILIETTFLPIVYKALLRCLVSVSLHNCGAAEREVVECSVGETFQTMATTCQDSIQKLFMKSGWNVNLFVLRFGTLSSLFCILMKRSFLLLTTIYSSFIAGHGFMTLDVNMPRFGVLFRYHDGGATCIFLDSCITGGFEVLSPIIVRFFERLEGIAKPMFVAREDDCSYLFYTSGSTGNPKGVLIPQRCVPNYNNHAFTFPGQFSRCDCFLWQTSPSFNQMLKTVLFAIQGGSRICPVSDEKDVMKTINLMERRNCSVIFCVPSMLSVLCESKAFIGISSMIMILSGGEHFGVKLAQKLVSEMTNAALWNAYGQTETTINVTVVRVSEVIARRKTVPIGRPFHNTGIRLLRQMAEGVSGIIFVSGASVGGGYRNLEKLTGEKFVYNVFENNGLGKMFNSGDAGLLTETGAVACVGRTDDQIKINGQRVELGAIQNVLLSCDNVKMCALLVYEVSEMKSIVAFVAGNGVERTALIVELQRRLALFELPQRIIILEKIPMTLGGKVDRVALAMLLRSEHKPDENINNHNHYIEVVTKAVKSVLCLSVDPGTKDSFWGMGGTSLMAISLEMRLRKEVGAGIGMGMMMQDGTIEGIARNLQKLIVPSYQKAGSNFYKSVKKFAGPDQCGIILFICSYGFLAETCGKFVNGIKAAHSVFVLEHIGFGAGPHELALSFSRLRMLFP
jgi:acyl-coenzyme A synthetase/AMP-(fatty) acid ligase